MMEDLYPDLQPFQVTKPKKIGSAAAIFPGSFNPWHEGHQDTLDKALKIFDKIVVLQTNSSSKGVPTPLLTGIEKYPGLKWRLLAEIEKERIIVKERRGFLADSIKAISEEEDLNITTVIRGLRNGYDLQTEMIQQYWYEDLKMMLPIIYLITDRKYAHISSSAIREVEALQKQSTKMNE